MPVEIRPFTPADFPAALALWQATPGIGLTEADSPDGIAMFLARNPGLSFTAVAAGRLIGTILCGHDGRRGLIHHLAVAAAHRRQGLGRRLVETSLALLRAEAIEKCHLFVRRDNTEGQAFWQSIGGEERTTLVMFSLTTESPAEEGEER